MKQKRRSLVAFLILLTTCFGQKLIHSYFLWLLSRAIDSPVFNSLSPTHLSAHGMHIPACLSKMVPCPKFDFRKKGFRIFVS